MKTFLTHVLYLAANPKAASSHVDAVYSRKCINFILRSVLGKMLGEKAQISACKDVAQIVVKEMNSIDFNPENAKEFNQETLFSQHLLVCALHEIGTLIVSLGTTAHDLITDQSLSKLIVFYLSVYNCAFTLCRNRDIKDQNIAKVDISNLNLMHFF